MDQAKVIDKIKKCLNLARCATADEAATAAFTAQKLIARYGIDEALLLTDKVELPEDEKVIEKDVFNFDGPRVVTWVLNLGGSLARVNNCKLWFCGGDNWGKLFKAYLRAAGRESDLSTIHYMMSYLVPEIEGIAKKSAAIFREMHGYSGGKNWANSFKVGCVSKITERLSEARDKAVAEARASAVDARDMVTSAQEVTVSEDGTPVVRYELAVIDNAIQIFGNRKKRAEEWVKKNVALHPGRSRATSVHGGAWHAGREAGGRIPLSSGPRLTMG